MWKFSFLILFLGSGFSKVFAQNIEQDLLKLLYNDIKKQNEYYLISKELKGVFLIVDPISGESEVNYPSNINDIKKAEFAKFTKNEQIKILNCNSSIIFLKDTLVIVDSIGFFSEGHIIFNQENSVINVIRNNKDKIKSTFIALFAVALRDNRLMISIANPQSPKQLYNYIFDLHGLGIKLFRTNVIDNKIHLE